MYIILPIGVTNTKKNSGHAITIIFEFKNST